MRASRALYGSPGTEKMGSFCDSTSELKMSIIGMPVRIIRSGTRRQVGLTGGPPMSTGGASTSGLPSRGRPAPSKTRPRRSSEKGTCMGRPRNRTRSPVETPCVPAKTWSETRSRSSRMTPASDDCVWPATTPSSSYPMPAARTVTTLPEICVISSKYFLMSRNSYPARFEAQASAWSFDIGHCLPASAFSLAACSPFSVPPRVRMNSLMRSRMRQNSSGSRSSVSMRSRSVAPSASA